MFAVLAAPEIEEAFIQVKIKKKYLFFYNLLFILILINLLINQVCGSTSKRELIIALDSSLPELFDNIPYGI